MALSGDAPQDLYLSRHIKNHYESLLGVVPLVRGGFRPVDLPAAVWVDIAQRLRPKDTGCTHYRCLASAQLWHNESPVLRRRHAESCRCAQGDSLPQHRMQVLAG